MYSIIPFQVLRRLQYLKPQFQVSDFQILIPESGSHNQLRFSSMWKVAEAGTHRHAPTVPQSTIPGLRISDIDS